MKKVLTFFVWMLIIYAVFDFLEKYSMTLAICAGIVILVAAIILIKKSDSGKAQYVPITLSAASGLPENDAALYVNIIKMLEDDMYSFTPHDLGVLGLSQSTTYYSNLYDKGFLDRIKRGTYALNVANLQRTLDGYYSRINANIARIKSSSFSKAAADASLAQYELDKEKIRLTVNKTIDISEIERYISTITGAGDYNYDRVKPVDYSNQ